VNLQGVYYTLCCAVGDSCNTVICKIHSLVAASTAPPPNQSYLTIANLPGKQHLRAKPHKTHLEASDGVSGYSGVQFQVIWQ